MSDGDALLAAILADPDDDTARLVYADWLQEHGREERAEFIRLQIELSRPGPRQHASRCPRLGYWKFPEQRPAGDGCGRCRRMALAVREQQLLHRHGFGWCDGLVGPDWEALGEEQVGPYVRVTCRRGTEFTGNFGLRWVRGFVRLVRCGAADWMRHADDILAAQPIEGVRLQTEPTWNYADVPGSTRVRLNGRWRVYDVFADLKLAVGDPISPALLRAEWPAVTFELPP